MWQQKSICRMGQRRTVGWATATEERPVQSDNSVSLDDYNGRTAKLPCFHHGKEEF